MKLPISVYVMTLNEEVNLPRSLASLAWSDDVVVVDSGSTDSTVAIAEAAGCRIIRRPFDNWSGHQNWILENVSFKYDWVFNLDADERVTEELATELAQVVARVPASVAAFRLRRRDYFRDTWLKRSTLYPTWLVRLYRPDRVRFERLVNPTASVTGETASLAQHIDHWPFSKGVGHWIARHNSYSTFEAHEYRKASIPPWSAFVSRNPNARRTAAKSLFARLPCRPLIKWLWLYVIRRGFLDGSAGFHYATLQAVYEYFIGLKVAELGRAAVRTQGLANGSLVADTHSGK